MNLERVMANLRWMREPHVATVGHYGPWAPNLLVADRHADALWALVRILGGPR